MKQWTKVEVHIRSGLNATPYIVHDHTTDIFKHVDRLFTHYFWLFIDKYYVVTFSGKREIESFAGLNYRCKLSPREQIILNDKNLKLKEALEKRNKINNFKSGKR